MSRGLLTITNVISLGGTPTAYIVNVDGAGTVQGGDHLSALLADGTSAIYRILDVPNLNDIRVIDDLTEAEDGEFGPPEPGLAAFGTPAANLSLTLLPYLAPGWDAMIRRNNFLTDSNIIGITGPTGFTGVTGVAGAIMGPIGNTGPTGALGGKGLTGPTGAKNAKGITGPSGPTGTTGSKGVSGATGAKGNKGNTGSTGNTGPTGFSDGSTGATGTKGVSGATGVAAGIGAIGQTGPTGPVGATGTKGNSGTTGTAGTAGAIGVTGTGLTGNTGNTGPLGAQGGLGGVGATGPSVPSISQGPTGPTGPQGIQGNQGPQGAQGITGITGPNGLSTSFYIPLDDVILHIAGVRTFQAGGYVPFNTGTVTSKSLFIYNRGSLYTITGSIQLFKNGVTAITGVIPISIAIGTMWKVAMPAVQFLPGDYISLIVITPCTPCTSGANANAGVYFQSP
jgi:hypothetical protein